MSSVSLSSYTITAVSGMARSLGCRFGIRLTFRYQSGFDASASLTRTTLGEISGLNSETKRVLFMSHEATPAYGSTGVFFPGTSVDAHLREAAIEW